MTIPGVILAGGRAKPDLEAATGQTVRALAVVNGKTLLAHVVDALDAAGSIGQISVVGDVPESARYTRLPDSGDFVANVLAGVSAYPDAPFVLIATSDLPFLTGANVETFVCGAMARAEATGAAAVYPVVPVAACYARFPAIKRTALRLREGEFTGGNLVLVRPDFLLKQKDRIAEAYAARKSPLKLAVMLGLGTVCRLLFSQKLAPNLLTLPMLEERVSRLLGTTGRALICDSPEIATDLDRASDFTAVQN